METSQASKTEPRWERRKEDRPSELAAAALDLFVEKGFAATRLDDVATRAGVSKGTLYLYFDSKDDLFKAVIESAVIPAVAQGEQIVEQFEGTSSDLLRRLVLGWWQLFGSTQVGGIPKLMISEARNFPELAQYYHDNVIVRGKRLFTKTLERGIASGEFRPIDVEYAVHVLIAPLLLKALWRHSFAACGCGPRELDPDRYFNTSVDIILNGLRATPQPSK
jgi:AcrR family transcriptional regulator